MRRRYGAVRALTVAVAIALAIAVGATTATVAAGNGKKAEFETSVGGDLEYRDDLAACVDADDPGACIDAVGGTEVMGIGFFIGAIIKFKAHKGNPTLDGDAFGACLADAVTVEPCLEELGVRIGGPSMPGIVNGILAHYVLRDVCPAEDVDCGPQPDAWPDGWAWADDYEQP